MPPTLMPRNVGRRTEDYDWRIRAPRWLLVSVIVMLAGVLPLFGTLLLWTFREQVKRTDLTAARVGDIDKRTSSVEAKVVDLNGEILAARIDGLRYQAYMARKNGDLGFADDLDARLREAEERRKTFYQEGQ